MKAHDMLVVSLIVEKMRLNSILWHGSTGEERKNLSAANRVLGEALRLAYGVPAVYDDETGTWYMDHIGGSKLYDVY